MPNGIMIFILQSHQRIQIASMEKSDSPLPIKDSFNGISYFDCDKDNDGPHCLNFCN